MQDFHAGVYEQTVSLSFQLTQGIVRILTLGPSPTLRYLASTAEKA